MVNNHCLVVSNMAFIFHFIYGMSSFPLTKSIIFRDEHIAPQKPVMFGCHQGFLSLHIVVPNAQKPGNIRVDDQTRKTWLNKAGKFPVFVPEKNPVFGLLANDVFTDMVHGIIS